MTARWMVHRHRVDLRAHLYATHPLDPARYLWSPCSDVMPASVLMPEDGRPRCKRCLKAEAKAKENAKCSGCWW